MSNLILVALSVGCLVLSVIAVAVSVYALLQAKHRVERTFVKTLEDKEVAGMPGWLAADVFSDIAKHTFQETPGLTLNDKKEALKECLCTVKNAYAEFAKEPGEK